MKRVRDVIRVATTLTAQGATPRELKLAIVASHAERIGCTVQDLLSADKRQDIKMARRMAMLDIKKTYGDSYASLGRLFGKTRGKAMRDVKLAIAALE